MRLSISSAMLAFTLGALGGCYGDTQEPASYRFDCKGDGDCKDPEQCIDGLCQIPCTFATFDDDCPNDQSFASCFNGVCSNLCELDDASACPSKQECISVPFDTSGLGGGVGGIDTTKYGVCGVECTSDSCPEGELCLDGICAPLSDPGETGGDTTGDTTGGTGN